MNAPVVNLDNNDFFSEFSYLQKFKCSKPWDYVKSPPMAFHFFAQIGDTTLTRLLDLIDFMFLDDVYD